MNLYSDIPELQHEDADARIEAVKKIKDQKILTK